MTNQLPAIRGYTLAEEAEYQALLARLPEEFTPVPRKHFDFTKICGNPLSRTTKAIVLHLFCVGWSVPDIGELIDAPPRATARYLVAAMREACPLDPEDVSTIREFELRRADIETKEAWAQFRRSCEDGVTETRTTDAEGNETKKVVRKGQSGNPAYLRILQEIGRRRERLLGLAQPLKVSIDKTERKLQITQIVVKTREEALAAKAAGLLE